jgi:hypothetical protein
MEPEVSLPCSQDPPLVPILSHMNPINALPTYLFKIRSNVIPSAHRFLESGLFMFFDQNFVRIYSRPLPIQWVSEALSLGVKQPGHEADHLPPSSAEGMSGAMHPLPQYSFMAWCSVKRKSIGTTALLLSPLSCYTTCPTHPPWFDHPNDIFIISFSTFLHKLLLQAATLERSTTHFIATMWQIIP